jgi:hypothetical protein
MEELGYLETGTWNAITEAMQFGAELDVERLQEEQLALVNQLVELQSSIETITDAGAAAWRAQAEAVRAALRDLTSRALKVATRHELFGQTKGLLLGVGALALVGVSAIYLWSRRMRV